MVDEALEQWMAQCEAERELETTIIRFAKRRGTQVPVAPETRLAFHRRAQRHERLCQRESPAKAGFLEQAEQLKNDYDNDNYSDYIEDASVHAGE